MRQESLKKEERLFLYLVSTFKTSAMVALGKMENPMTNKTQINLEQASYYVDLLDMLQSKAKGNMSQYEEQMLINTVSELKMEIIKQKPLQKVNDQKSKNLKDSLLEGES
tara:strand:- start:107 stop:436 length:330 start_codon:yes stop_codon:yes gene_type:complete